MASKIYETTLKLSISIPKNFLGKLTWRFYGCRKQGINRRGRDFGFCTLTNKHTGRRRWHLGNRKWGFGVRWGGFDKEGARLVLITSLGAGGGDWGRAGGAVTEPRRYVWQTGDSSSQSRHAANLIHWQSAGENILLTSREHGCQIWPQSGTDRPQMGQILDFFRPDLSMYLNLIWKSPRFVPFGS